MKNTDYAFASFTENTKIHSKIYPTVILINIDSFNIYDTKDAIVSFELRSKEGLLEHGRNSPYKSIHLILKNVGQNGYNIDKDLYRFARVMKSESLEEVWENSKGDEKFMEASKKIEDYMSNEDFVIYYDREELHEWEKEQIKKDGVELGMEQGLEKGFHQAIYSMYDSGMTTERIASVLKKSEEDIKNILKKR